MFEMSKLFQLPAQSTDGTMKGVLEDAIVDTRACRVSWWRVDLGGPLGHAPVLVRGACASLSRNRLLMTASDADLQAARDRALEGHDDPIDLHNVPDLVTGPFGYTVSPSMFMALVTAWRRKRDRQRVTLPDFAGDQSLWASDALGRNVFGPRGSMGRLRDVRINWEGDLTHLDIAKEINGKGRLVRAEALRHLPRKGDHLVIADPKSRPAWHPTAMQTA